MAEIKSLVFVSNYFNHHQKYLSDEFHKLLGDGYRFISTVPMEEKRKALGWGEYDIDYIVNAHESLAEYQKAEKLIEEADVVILGSAPEKMLRERIKAGKLTFRYSERLLRHGLELKKYFYRFFRYHYFNPRKCNVYLLCSSAYTSADYKKFGLFKNKAFKWAYFTEAKEYENVDKLIEEKNGVEILWCGRFLKLKHLDDVIRVLSELINEGFKCKLKVIGTGPEEENLKELSKTLKCENSISFVGTMAPEQVRENMEKADIFLFTSDFNEGWGAVLNESMNSCCAVVSSHAAGATPFLVSDGKNGFVYESGNLKDLYEKVKYLLENPEQAKKMGREAYETITKTWSPEVAANRFLALSNSILNSGNPFVYSDGPCSPSKPLKNNWYKGKNK